MRDGQVLQGTIVELRHGESVTLRTANGATLSFPWSEIAETRLASAGAPAPAALTPGPGRPRLHIELSRPASVHLMAAGDHRTARTLGAARYAGFAPQLNLRSVCRAPCDQVVDGSHGYSFVFAGEGVPSSRPLYLADLDGEVTARVRPGRTGLLIAGGVALPFAAFGMLGGGFFAGFGDNRTEQRAGAALLGVGVGLLVTSIVLLVRGTTRYKLYRR